MAGTFLSSLLSPEIPKLFLAHRTQAPRHKQGRGTEGGDQPGAPKDLAVSAQVSASEHSDWD